MKFELMTVVTLAGERKAPITVFINANEIDIDHRINLVVEGYKNRCKFDEVSKSYKATITKLLDEMRTALHGGAKVVSATVIALDDVTLEFQVYQSQFKD